MSEVMKAFKKIGFYPADIMLPKAVDMTKWSVVACDQFTSQPEYWEAVEKEVGEEPSTLRLILPEVKLENDNVAEEIEQINKNMQDYLDRGIFETYKEALIYVERTQSDGKIRHGVVGMIDLEDYEFVPGNKALIRATEGTVLTRIPPRVKVRENAPIELPHVMLLIDDPDKKVIEPLATAKEGFKEVYNFDMLCGGGHISGYMLDDEWKIKLAEALNSLNSSECMEKKYGMGDKAPMVFAVGDGNHSLATAKQCYENQKKITNEEDWDKLPSRYALVEVVNNHDDALGFEPIHRVIFDTDAEKMLDAILEYFPDSIRAKGLDAEELISSANTEGEMQVPEGAQLITYYKEGEKGCIVIPKPELMLTVGSLQSFLDEYLKANPAGIDYVHEDEVTISLGSKPGNIAFLLPAMSKEELFKTVIADGVLPRKTFSMGHAQDKRYYTEARKIR